MIVAGEELRQGVGMARNNEAGYFNRNTYASNTLSY